jgi:hypothetical protein
LFDFLGEEENRGEGMSDKRGEWGKLALRERESGARVEIGFFPDGLLGSESFGDGNDNWWASLNTCSGVDAGGEEEVRFGFREGEEVVRAGNNERAGGLTERIGLDDLGGSLRGGILGNGFLDGSAGWARNEEVEVEIEEGESSNWRRGISGSGADWVNEEERERVGERGERVGERVGERLGERVGERVGVSVGERERVKGGRGAEGGITGEETGELVGEGEVDLDCLGNVGEGDSGMTGFGFFFINLFEAGDGEDELGSGEKHKFGELGGVNASGENVDVFCLRECDSAHSDKFAFKYELLVFSFNAEHAAKELSRTNISFNFVHPPPTRTNIIPFVNFKLTTRSSNLYFPCPNLAMGFGSDTFGGTSCTNLVLM